MGDNLHCMEPADPLTRDLLLAGPWHRAAAPFALLQVEGADATDFLQRVCSQDVQALTPGGAAPAAFLDAKGRIAATCVVARAGQGFLLEAQQHQADRLLALLERYHFAEKVTFARCPAACVEVVAAVVGDGRTAAVADGHSWRFAFARRGVQFDRWHLPAGGAAPPPTGRPLDADLAECLRMGAGIVAVGLDTDASTLLPEALLDDHASRTKGCYTGQEIVARIHTYGHTNRALCLLHLAAGPAVTVPQLLCEADGDLQVGRVMRAVPVPGRDLRVGLGYLPPDYQPVGTLLRLADGDRVVVAGFGT